LRCRISRQTCSIVKMPVSASALTPHRGIMSSETSSFPQSDDAEARMRRSLGLDAPSSAPSSPKDPLKGARQAIRSHAAARDYAERQLGHAEATIQDLRTKLHRARQEKDAAIEAARSAAGRKITVERTMISTETAMAAEKAARDRGDRALRESRATISHLQSKLDAAAQGLETIRAELAAERQGRKKAEDALAEAMIAPQITAPASLDEAAVSPIRRSVGRPRKLVAVQPVSEPGRPMEATGSAAVVPPARRPVGRPRRTEPVQPVQTSTKAVAVAKTPRKKADSPRQTAGEQEPVQWWVEGWNRRRR
jgi:hypothetical protein